MGALDELFGILPYAGAAANGYLQGQDYQQKMAAAQQAMDLERQRNSREATTAPLQDQLLLAEIKKALGTENRAQSEFSADEQPVTPDFLSAVGKARPGYVGPAQGGSTVRDVTKTAPLFPSTADITKANAAGTKANTGAADQTAKRINEMISVRAKVAGLIDAGKPMDMALLQDDDIKNAYSASHGDLQAMLRIIDARIAELSGNKGVAPAARNLPPAPIIQPAHG